MRLRGLARFSSMILLLEVLVPPMRAQEPPKTLSSITAGDLFEIEKVLVSPEMEGRLAGTEGYNRSARWAAERFREWGLKPVYGSDYFQPFTVAYNEMRETALSLFLPGTEGKMEVRELQIYKDFCPTLYSGFADKEAEVVFAGFGISAPDLGWDDYAGLEVAGKIVAFMGGTPRLEGKDFSRYSPRHGRLVNAQKHGAAGILLVGRAVVSGNGQYVEGLPMVMVGDDVARLLFSGKGYDVRTVESLLRDGRPISFATGVKARLKAMGRHHQSAATCNVVAMLEGSDPILKDEYLLFGGHLDHLGPWPVLHPGANDNASGSAVVLGLARAFSRLQTRPKRSIVFALFGAEELGLLGSRHMAGHLPASPSRMILMSNHDINGVGKAIHVAGGVTYPDLYKLMEAANARYNFGAGLSASEISPVDGNSDYAPFLEKGIPAYNIGVRGGAGGGIHTAEDSIYTITPKIMEDIVRLFFAAGFLYADR